MSGFIGREQRTVLPEPVGVVDVGREASRAGAMLGHQADQIAGVLDQVGTRIGAEVKKEAKREGEAAGWSDPMLRDAEGKLQPPSLEQGFLLSEGEKARRAVLAVRYGSEFVLQNQGALTGLRAQNAADPDAFLSAARAHVEGVTSQLPTALRAQVSEGLTREIGRNYASMQTERLQREREEAKAGGTLTLTNSLRDYSSALAGAQPVPVADAGVIPPALAPAIEAAARETGIPAPILAAVARHESNFGQLPDRPGDGKGVMQVLDSTARRPGFGVEGVDPASLRDPSANIMFGARYLAGRAGAGIDWNDPKQRDEALRRYNGGGDPDYVAKVNRYLPQQGAATVAGGLREGMASQLNGMVAAGLITSAARDGQLRHIDVVMPIASGLQQEAIRRGPDAIQAVTGALLAGPGAPGWRPEWARLDDKERQDLATVLDRSARHTRAETEHAVTVSTREAQTRLALIDTALVPLNEKAATTGLSEAETTQRQQLLDEAVGLTERARSSHAATLLRGAAAADAAGRRGQEADTLSRDVIGRAMGVLAADPDPGSQARTQALAAQIGGRDLQTQATIWSREASEAEARLRTARTAAEGDTAFATALGGGPTVERNAEMQGRAARLLQAAEMDPLDSRAAPLMQAVVAGNALPQTVVTRGALALEPGASPQTMVAFANLHEQMRANPRTQNRWSSALGDNLDKAYTGMAEAVRGIDPKAPDAQQAFERVRTRALRVAAGEKVVEDALATLGATNDDRNKALAGLVTGAITGVDSRAQVPAKLRTDLQAEILTNISAGLTPERAQGMAMQTLAARGWGVSELGTGPDMPQVDMAGVNGLIGGVGPDGGSPVAGLVPPRWMLNPPEQYTARYGAGGEKGTRWIRERLGDVARQADLPSRENLTPGVNLLLQAETDPRAPKGIDGKPLFQVWFQQPNGEWQYTGLRDEQGQMTAEPLRLDLAAEAEMHNRRWAAPDGPGDQMRAREAVQERRRQGANAFLQDDPIAFQGYRP